MDVNVEIKKIIGLYESQVGFWEADLKLLKNTDIGTDTEIITLEERIKNYNIFIKQLKTLIEE